MPRLQIKLLGGFQARAAGGSAIDIASRKTRALLAYLALPPGRPHTRDALVALLWSDRDDKQAHASLRQALVELGRALEGVAPTPLVKNRDTLSVDPESVAVDAVAFEQLAGGSAVDDLERAAVLYAGDLLEGIGVRDPSFEEWLLIERQRLRNCAISVLKRLLELRTGSDGIADAERLVALDPLQEEGYRALMRLHTQAGEIGLALRYYERCRDILRQELNVAPSAETEALHREIRGGQHQKAPAGREESPPSSAPAQEPPADGGPSGKPSIAVLPFENLSGDPEQRYFSDGITGDLIIELSRFRSLTVIARNSSFLYRDKAVDVRQIGRELGADYILEGSARRAGDRIRISAELAEAATGKHVWAERYDRELGDLFKVQDEVTQAIVTTLPRRIDDAGARAAQRKRPENLNAFECYLRGLAYVLEFEFIEHHPAREMLERAVSLDPNLAPAYAILAVMELRHWWACRSLEALDKAFALSLNSVRLDQNDALCHCSLGGVYLERRQLAEAEFHLRKGLALNPNDSRNVVFFAGLLAYCGQIEEALSGIDKVFRLDPFAPQWYHSSTGMVYFCARDYEGAIQSFGRITRGLSHWDCLYVTSSYGHLGRLEEAQAAIDHYNSLRPTLPLIEHARAEPFKNEADLDHLLAGLRKAGLAN